MMKCACGAVGMRVLVATVKTRVRPCGVVNAGAFGSRKRRIMIDKHALGSKGRMIAPLLLKRLREGKVAVKKLSMH